MSLISYFNNIKQQKGYSLIALIDPDNKTEKQILNILHKVNNVNFDAIFIGGSTLSENDFINSINLIKKNTELKIIIFPSSHRHISNIADGILFTTLLNSNNRKYLIEEQLKSSTRLKGMNIEVIPTGYLHLDGGIYSSIEKVTNQRPISYNNLELITSYAHLCEHLNFKYLYLEAGSGAKNRIPPELISTIKKRTKIDIIAGGGITTINDINSYKESNVTMIVIGNLLETDIDIDNLKKQTECNY